MAATAALALALVACLLSVDVDAALCPVGIAGSRVGLRLTSAPPFRSPLASDGPQAARYDVEKGEPFFSGMDPVYESSGNVSDGGYGCASPKLEFEFPPCPPYSPEAGNSSSCPMTITAIAFQPASWSNNSLSLASLSVSFFDALGLQDKYSVDTTENSTVYFNRPAVVKVQLSNFSGLDDQSCGFRVEMFTPCVTFEDFAGQLGQQQGAAGSWRVDNASGVVVKQQSLRISNLTTTKQASLHVDGDSVAPFRSWRIAMDAVVLRYIEEPRDTSNSNTSADANTTGVNNTTQPNITNTNATSSSQTTLTWAGNDTDVHVSASCAGQTVEMQVVGGLSGTPVFLSANFSHPPGHPITNADVTFAFQVAAGQQDIATLAIQVDNIYIIGQDLWDCSGDVGVTNVTGECLPCDVPSTFQNTSGMPMCVDTTQCEPGKFETEAPTATSDRVCTECSEGLYKNASGNGPCSPVTKCARNQYLKQSATPSSDAVCEDCDITEVSIGTECVTEIVCSPGQFVQEEVALGIPKLCGSCPPGSFSSISNAAVCHNHTACALSEFVETPPSNSSDSVCAACDETCLTCSGAGPSDCVLCRNAAHLNLASPGSNVSGEAERFLLNGRCFSVNDLPNGTWANTSSGQLAPLSPPCVLNATFESAAPTATTDRVCATVTQCNDTSYQTKAPTTLIDRVCSSLEPCRAGQQVVQPPTATSNWVCADCAAGTTDHDRQPATPCLPCGAGHYSPPGSADPCFSLRCDKGFLDFDDNASTPCFDCRSINTAGSFLDFKSSGCLSCSCPAYKCIAGWYDHDKNVATECVSCPAGKDSARGDVTCRECTVGKARADNAVTPCQDCAQGTYQDAPNQAKCKPCTACGSGFEVKTPCTATTDTECQAAQASSGGSSVAPVAAGAGIGVLALLLLAIVCFKRRNNKTQAVEPVLQTAAPDNYLTARNRAESALVKDIAMFEPVSKIRSKKQQKGQQDPAAPEYVPLAEMSVNPVVYSDDPSGNAVAGHQASGAVVYTPRAELTSSEVLYADPEEASAGFAALAEQQDEEAAVVKKQTQPSMSTVVEIPEDITSDTVEYAVPNIPRAKADYAEPNSGAPSSAPGEATQADQLKADTRGTDAGAEAAAEAAEVSGDASDDDDVKVGPGTAVYVKPAAEPSSVVYADATPLVGAGQPDEPVYADPQGSLHPTTSTEEAADTHPPVEENPLYVEPQGSLRSSTVLSGSSTASSRAASPPPSLQQQAKGSKTNPVASLQVAVEEDAYALPQTTGKRSSIHLEKTQGAPPAVEYAEAVDPEPLRSPKRSTQKAPTSGSGIKLADDSEEVDPEVLGMYAQVNKRRASAQPAEVLYASVDEPLAGPAEVHYGNLGMAAVHNQPEPSDGSLRFHRGTTRPVLYENESVLAQDQELPQYQTLEELRAAQKAQAEQTSAASNVNADETTESFGFGPGFNSSA